MDFGAIFEKLKTAQKSPVGFRGYSEFKLILKNPEEA
jgi:hypothetical protein